jgi:NTE family protein
MRSKPERCGTDPKIAVVVGSGGIKPACAIALFELLEDLDINIDLLIGCSGGAIVSAMRGFGYNSAEITDLFTRHLTKSLFSHIDYRTLLGIAKMPFGRFDKTRGILKPQRLIDVLKIIFKNSKFDSLKIPTLVQVTNVDNGEGILIDSGDIAEAVYSSAAQFPFFPPLNIDGKWYVDGAFSSPLPVLEAVNRGYDVIIAIAIEQQVKMESKSFIEYFHQFISRSYTSTQKKQMALAIDMHHHEIVIINMHFDEVIHMWDVDKLPVIVQTGKKIIDKKKNEIIAAIDNFKNRRKH